ncbi:MAG: response regulator transcription factor [Gammaproteobacteria bacterium]|nr:response regulator transcription factor [Gammaproteobacteria bacterium]
MKLLIIEDSVRLRQSLKAGFKHLGYAIDDTGDGKEGLSFAMINDYDVIILDLMLPSMDGLSILEQLRDHRKNTNVLILSAKDQVEDRIKGLNLGADDYMVKPFSFDELHARLLTLVRRMHDIKSPYIDLGQLAIDTTMRQASANNQLLDLTPKEYLILEHLALNQGRVITYESMENQLYSSIEAVTRNTLEAHVSALRKKLKLAQLPDLLKTKRGFGYYIAKP